MRTRTALRWAGAAFGLLVFGWLLAGLAPHADSLGQAWRSLDGVDVLWAMLAFFGAQLAFAAAWHRLLKGSGERGHFAGDAARWSVSLAGKYFPGKVWQAVARYGLYHGAARGSRVAPAYAREMLLSTGAAMALVALGAGAAPPQARGLVPVFAVGALLLLLLATPVLERRAIALAERWLPGRLAASDAGWSGGVAALTWQLAGYLLLGLGFFALGRGMGWFDASHAGVAIAALCFGGVAGIAAFFVPAGIGVREAAIAWFLAPLIGAGPALALAVLARAWISLGEALMVAAGMLWLRRSPAPGAAA